MMLEEYEGHNGLGNIRHFTDDRISGTRFDRSGFTAMLEQIEQGNVAVVCIKDMNRLGRDNLKVRQRNTSRTRKATMYPKTNG